MVAAGQVMTERQDGYIVEHLIISTVDKDCTSDGSETERLVRRTDVRVLGSTKDKGGRVPHSGKVSGIRAT